MRFLMALVRHGGVRPDEQGEGDSVVAVFVRTSDAAAAALDAHRELSELGLAVRMALHTGEAELRGKSNYFGSTIIRCARLRAIGHGGQILVSDATRTLIGDHPPEAGWLRDLGWHRLKDLGRPERVWQLCPREGASTSRRSRRSTPSGTTSDSVDGVGRTAAERQR